VDDSLARRGHAKLVAGQARARLARVGRGRSWPTAPCVSVSAARRSRARPSTTATARSSGTTSGDSTSTTVAGPTGRIATAQPERLRRRARPSAGPRELRSSSRWHEPLVHDHGLVHPVGAGVLQIRPDRRHDVMRRPRTTPASMSVHGRGRSPPPACARRRTVSRRRVPSGRCGADRDSSRARQQQGVVVVRPRLRERHVHRSSSPHWVKFHPSPGPPRATRRAPSPRLLQRLARLRQLDLLEAVRDQDRDLLPLSFCSIAPSSANVEGGEEVQATCRDHSSGKGRFTSGSGQRVLHGAFGPEPREPSARPTTSPITMTTGGSSAAARARPPMSSRRR